MEKNNNFLLRFISEFNKIGKKEKIIIFIILGICFFAGLGISTELQKLSSENPKPTKSVTSVTPSPSPFVPAKVSIKSNLDRIVKGATFSATVRINSPTNGVEAADFLVNFDPKYLKVATASSGKFFGYYPQKKIGKDYVKISGMATLTGDSFIVPKGEGTIASITFQALSATDSTKIRFDREKTVVASKGKNILGSIEDLLITIK